MNFVRPVDEFIRVLRELCTRHGTVLIFDEVMTGYRVAAGGAQGLFRVTPDLTTPRKVIGGGMPVGAFCGRGDFIGKLGPLGPGFQAGTLAGKPVTVTPRPGTLKHKLRP